MSEYENNLNENNLNETELNEYDNGRRFKPRSKYFTITVYAIIAFVICAIIAKLIFNFSTVFNALKIVTGVLAPFIAGGIIAYLINPLYKFLDFTFFKKWLRLKKPGIRKGISMFLSYIIVLGVIAAIIAFVIPQFISSIGSLIKLLGGVSLDIEDQIDKLQQHFRNLNLSFIVDGVKNLVPTLIAKLQGWAEGLVGTLFSTSVGIVSGIINAFLSVIISIYILTDKARLKRTLRNIYYSTFRTREKAARVARVTKESSTIFSSFFTGKIFDSLIVGVLCGLGMLILGLPYPLLVAVIVGVTNIIPYFGPFIGAVPSILIMLISGWKQALILTIFIIVLQQIDGNLIGPKILGKSTGLRPIWVIFAITIGSWAGGIAGMIFGVPIMAVIGNIVEEIVNNRLRRKGLETLIETEGEQEKPNLIDRIKYKVKESKEKKAAGTGDESKESKDTDDKK